MNIKMTGEFYDDVERVGEVISIDDILQKHFPGREDEWPEIRKSLEQGREIEKEHKEG